MYAASKLDQHEQWVGFAGPSQKKTINQVVGLANWTVTGIMAVENTMRPVCLARYFKVGISISVQSEHKHFFNL